jgi:hypothetical protein
MTDRELRKIAKRLQKVGLLSGSETGLFTLWLKTRSEISEMDLTDLSIGKWDATKMGESLRVFRLEEYCKSEAAMLAAWASPARPIDAPITNFCHLLLHFVVPRSERPFVERDLEQQFYEEASDSRLGLRRARFLYCKRVIADNVLAWYIWGRLPKRVRIIILSLITAAVLKSFGLLPTLATLKQFPLK